MLGFLLASAALARTWPSGVFNRTPSRQTGHQTGIVASFASVARPRTISFHQPATPPGQQVLPTALQGMPLAFIENRGQADARAAVLVQGRDTTAYFTAQGLTLAFTQGGGEK